MMGKFGAVDVGGGLQSDPGAITAGAAVFDRLIRNRKDNDE